MKFNGLRIDFPAKASIMLYIRKQELTKLLDGEIANQQTNLMKQAIELKDLRGSLTEALRKVCAV